MQNITAKYRLSIETAKISGKQEIAMPGTTFGIVRQNSKKCNLCGRGALWRCREKASMALPADLGGEAPRKHSYIGNNRHFQIILVK
jgi:hypothetical protein